MKPTCIAILIALLSFSCKNEVKKENTYEEEIEVRDPKPIYEQGKTKIATTPEAIAQANGFQQWDTVKEILFTFNVKVDTTLFSRSWSWKPKENLVTMSSKEDTITYNRNKIDSIALKADQSFINDKYWLLAPFNLIWDADNFTSKHTLKSVAPISKKEMQKLTIVYKNEGGYSPGDAYDFYFEGNFIIKEWVFRKKNSEKPSLITSWEDYKIYSGLKIAKTHKRDEGDWTLYFTDIKVITE